MLKGVKDMRNYMVQDEELGIQRRSEKIAKWTLYVGIATLFISLATLLYTIF